MLLQFKVKNFASFLDEASLDMRATNIKEHEYALLSVSEKFKEKVLPVAAIYGANAAGKTNLIRAIQVFAHFVKNSVDFDTSDVEASYHLPIDSFLFSFDSYKQPSEFKINLVVDELEFLYEVTCDKKQVYLESLKAKMYSSGVYSTIYTKETSKKITLKKNKLSAMLNIKQDEIEFANSMLKNNVDLLLTALGRRGSEPFVQIYRWFETIVNVGNLKPKSSYICREGSRVKELYDDENEKNRYLSFLQKADPCIYGIGIKQQKDNKDYTPYYAHKVLGSEVTVDYPVTLESEGTLRLFELYPSMRYILRDGGLLVADELSAGLHPYLLQYILSLFRSENTNPHKAQLIFNLHNPTILNNRYLRRDEIWFVEKDRDGKSELYSLVDIRDEDGLKIRNDVDFGKWYLLGRFGGVPNVENWEA